MKPNFALNLSHDGIGLLHRKKGTKNGWTLMGEVAIDDPALGEKLDMLRKNAADLEKGGLATKLVIPNSQILYTEIDAPGPDDIAREVQIRKGLEGLTPYSVGELVFDWRKAAGTKVLVAILARETLNEAESFAKDHRLNPVSFVARPAAKGFKGEVFFGKTAGVSALLGPDGKIEPDDGPVPDLTSLRASPARPPQPKTTAEPDNKNTAKPAPKPSNGNATEPQHKQTNPIIQPAGTPPTKDYSQPSKASGSVISDGDDARIAALLADVPEPSSVRPPAKTVVTAAKPAVAETTKSEAGAASATPVLAPFPPTPEETEEDADSIQPVPPSKAPADIKGSTQEAPPAAQEKPEPTPPVSPSKGSGPVLPPIPPKRPGPPIPAIPARAPTPATTPLTTSFSSRRIPATTDGKPAIPLTRAQIAASAVAPSIQAKAASSTLAAPKSPKTVLSKGSTITSPSLAKDDTTPSKSTNAKTANRAVGGLLDRASQGAQGFLDRTKSVTTSFASRRAKSVIAKTPTPDATTSKTSVATNIAPLPNTPIAPYTADPTPTAKVRPALGKPKTQSDDVQREVDRMTMFGERKSQKPEIGGKHKYLGLILTLVLLLVMAIVAMSSVFFFSDEANIFDQGPKENPFAVAAIPDTNLVAPVAEGTADVQPLTQQPLAPSGGDSAALQTPGDQAGSIDDVLSSVLVNDIEPEPPADGTVAPLAGDIPQTLSDEAAAAQYAASGVLQRAPAAPGEPQSSRIDDLYIASIDPATSSHDAVALPTEVTRSQEARPASPLPPPAPGTNFALDTRGLVTPTPEGTLSPDGVLIYSGRPDFVAPARPTPPESDIVTPDELRSFRPKPRPEGLVEDNERAQLGGITRSEMASLRPTARPASVQTEAGSGGDAAPNELAVNASPTPGYRPEGFSTIVTVARALAEASDGSSVSATPASATTTPSIPTRASVATQATIDNALRLNAINLIGIYGSSSERRALVRLKSGRYIKVSVGDRLNGGQVLSISETRLIYKKSNKNITLDMLPLG